LAESRSLGLRSVESRLLGLLVITAYRQGRLTAGLTLNRQSLEIQRETGHRVSEAISLSNLCEAWLKLGDLTQARRDLDRELQMLRANGDRAMEGWALGLMSALALLQGDETRALALARSALDIAVAAQAPSIAAITGLKLGDAELALGRFDAARQACAQVRAQALTIDHSTQHDSSAGLARVALAKGDEAGALSALQPVFDHAVADGMLDGTEDARLIELTCYQALTRARDPRAAAWLQRAHVALMNQAEAISDGPTRQGLLRNNPHHRKIVSDWAQRDGSEAQ